MNEVSPAWRRALSEGPLRSATFWVLFLFQVAILEGAVSLIVKIGASLRDMFDFIPIIILAFVLAFIGYGLWLVLQAYQEARTAVGTEHEAILARYSYLTVKMCLIAEGCTLLCLRVAGWAWLAVR